MRYSSFAGSVLLAAIIAATPAMSVTAAELEGVKADDSIKVAGKDLVLQGLGLRKKAFFRVYVAALYVPEKKASAEELIAQKGPRRVTLFLLRNLSAEDISKALLEGMEKNHSEAQMATLKDRAAQLVATFNSVKQLKEGEQATLEYIPDGGTQIFINGNKTGAAIPGEDFYTAVLRIWLGNEPADAGLKKGWLGVK